MITREDIAIQQAVNAASATGEDYCVVKSTGVWWVFSAEVVRDNHMETVFETAESCGDCGNCRAWARMHGLA